MTIKQGWIGRFYEDFEVGDVYRSRIGRTITDGDNVLFTLMSNNTNQIHFNVEYARAAGFNKPLVNSIVTLAVVAGLGVADVSENGFALGWDYIRLPTPVFAGDTIYAESEVIGKRESGSRPHHGIITVRTTGKKADGTVFMTFERSCLIPLRGHAVDDRLDY